MDVLYQVLPIIIYALLSILLVNNISKKTIKNFNIDSNIKILSLFLIGLCNLLPFIIIRGFIYQLAIMNKHLSILKDV